MEAGFVSVSQPQSGLANIISPMYTYKCAQPQHYIALCDGVQRNAFRIATLWGDSYLIQANFTLDSR